MTTYLDLLAAIDQEAGIVPCQNAPDFFFPDPIRKRMSRKMYENAKKLCDTCPITNTCLQYALDNNEHDGMWGGLTPEQRHTLQRRTA